MLSEHVIVFLLVCRLNNGGLFQGDCNIIDICAQTVKYFSRRDVG